MKKLEFLKLAIQNKCYQKRAWMMAAFALVKEAPDEYLKKPYIGRLVQDLTSVRFYTGNSESPLEVIEDAKPGQPLFNFRERLTIDASFGIDVPQPVETSLGTLIVNCILLNDVFGSRIPYMTGKLSIDAMETVIASKLRDTPLPGEPRDPQFVYVDEYIKFVDNVQYVCGFSQLCVYSATQKNMVTAPGFKEFKAKLNEKYKGKLNDPVILTQYEKELADYDEAWVKDDPTNGILMSGRVKANARRKMFLSVGSGMNIFTDSLEVKPVTTSLEDGWPTDPELFAAMLSSARSGSFSRGSETQKGGVSAKVLLRATSNFKIEGEDCGSSVGILRSFNKKTIDQLVGRTVKTSSGWKLVATAEDAGSLLDKPLFVRSPMYCHSQGDVICKVCAGNKLAENPNGISTPITEVSAIILATAMKAMHGKVLSTAHLDIETAFS